MERESFILYSSWYDAIKLLTQEQKGELLDAIFNYHISGTTPEQSSTINLAFRFLKPAMDANISKYQAICEKNQQNGKLGGRPKKTERLLEKANGFFENPNDNDIDNDNVNESENKKKGLVEQAQPSSKNNFIDSIIDVFKDCYKQNRNVEYVITPKGIGKERQAASNILTSFKQLHPDHDSEAMLTIIKDYFTQALQLNDKFYKDSISLSILSSQFNQISAKIASNLNDNTLTDTSTKAGVNSLNRIIPNKDIPKQLKEYVLEPENEKRYTSVIGERPQYIIDYFIDVNYDSIITKSINEAAQYFVNFFKKQEELTKATKYYKQNLRVEQVEKSINEIFNGTIEHLRPYLETIRISEHNYKRYITDNFTNILYCWQKNKNPEDVKSFMEDQRKETHRRMPAH